MNFTKQDLQNGDILINRLGEQRMLVNGILAGWGSYTLLEHYDQDLSYKVYGCNSYSDIIKVRRPNRPLLYCPNHWEEAPIIWEKENTKAPKEWNAASVPSRHIAI